ncbi:chitotriosidase-1-like [Chenopodium quinoa]|uniref:chitotriosidase-1-like n=1 Tax=Chenopodium quinoa TaxID=63459 RepID=UPI000B793ABB|nr:chitotriosidase-1-like [Chenopodium quinoa]
MGFTVNKLMKFMLFLVQLIHTLAYYGDATDKFDTSWIKSGYWLTVSEFLAPDVDSSLFTHLYCAFAGINSTTYQLSIPSSDVQYVALFTNTVKRNNPSIQTLLSVGDHSITPTFLSMISNSSSRKSFINSSIQTALTYGFNGLDLCCFLPNTTSDSLNMAKLFDEWRSSVDH